jgi:hypothetical protein
MGLGGPLYYIAVRQLWAEDTGIFAGLAVCKKKEEERENHGTGRK